MLDCARALVPPDWADCLIGHPVNTAAGPRGVAVPLGRAGQRRRARADAAQPAQCRGPVPRLVRRRGWPRVRRTAGRRQHRARRLLRAVLGSVRSLGGDRGVARDCRQRVRGGCAGWRLARAPVGCAAPSVRRDRMAGAARIVAARVRAAARELRGRAVRAPRHLPRLPRRRDPAGGAAPQLRSAAARRTQSSTACLRLHRRAAQSRVPGRQRAARAVAPVLHSFGRRQLPRRRGAHQRAGSSDLPVTPGHAGASRFGGRHRDVLRTAGSGVLLRPSRRRGRRRRARSRWPALPRAATAARSHGRPSRSAAESRSLARGGAARQRLAGGRRRQRAPAQSRASASASCCCCRSAWRCWPRPRGARSGWRASRWSSWPASRTSCARRSR